MLGQNDKLWSSLKQLVLFGAILGLIFGSGALGLTDVYADKKDDDKKHDDDKKDKKHDDDKKDKKHDDDKKDKKHDDDEKDHHGNGNFKDVFRGDGPPPNKLGKKGDLYFDTNNDPNSCMDFYVKVDKYTWEKRGTLCDVETLEIDWNQINGIPDGLVELAGLNCDEGQIAKTDSSGTWICADDEDGADTLEELITCDEGQIAKTDSSGTWICADDEDGADTLEELITCNTDEILRYDATNGWTCSDDKGGVEITTVRTVFGDTDEEGVDVELSPIDPSSEDEISASCGSGKVIVGYDVLYPLEPEVDKVAFTTYGLDIFNSGEDLSIIVYNIGIRLSGGEVETGSLDAIELVLFCASTS